MALDEKLLTTAELSSLTGLPESWIYANAAAGKLPSLKLGHYVRFRRSEIEPWLEAQRREPQPAGR
jgi:excisionase family DNA binding protein